MEEAYNLKGVTREITIWRGYIVNGVIMRLWFRV